MGSLCVLLSIFTYLKKKLKPLKYENFLNKLLTFKI